MSNGTGANAERDQTGPAAPLAAGTNASRWIFLLLCCLMIGGLIAVQMFRFDAGPPPAEIASDELLVLGRRLYLERCTTCHGADGLGNGPLARSLGGPPPGNLTDGEWKHGDHPDQVRRVIAEGVPGTSMTGWGNTFEASEIDALAAYVYYLADQPVPESLRPQR